MLEAATNVIVDEINLYIYTATTKEILAYMRILNSRLIVWRVPCDRCHLRLLDGLGLRSMRSGGTQCYWYYSKLSRTFCGVHFQLDGNDDNASSSLFISLLILLSAPQFEYSCYHIRARIARNLRFIIASLIIALFAFLRLDSNWMGHGAQIILK